MLSISEVRPTASDLTQAAVAAETVESLRVASITLDVIYRDVRYVVAS